MILFLLSTLLVRYSSADSDLMLTVLPFGRNLVLEENADLNLTCKVKSHGKPNERFDLTWKLPTRSSANGDRVSVFETNDQLTVTIHDLQKDDTGFYVCELLNKGIIRTRKIQVFIRSKKCMKHFFDCGNGICVPRHYVCDGNVDCPSGYDEAFKHCGPDACHGKILCEGRCIPKELCCDPTVDVNCSVNYVMPCCHGFLNPGLYQYGAFQHHELDASPCPSSVDCRFGRIIGFGNSILYVVASCAIVVLVVSSVVMFLACRICSRRAEELQRWSRVTENELRLQSLTASLNQRDLEPVHNVDYLFEEVNFNSDCYETDPSENFALVNFVEGVGFQVADCRPKPPPYTENTIGIPPPPYESNSDIANVQKDSSSEA